MYSTLASLSKSSCLSYHFKMPGAIKQLVFSVLISHYHLLCHKIPQSFSTSTKILKCSNLKLVDLIGSQCRNTYKVDYPFHIEVPPFKLRFSPSHQTHLLHQFFMQESPSSILEQKLPIHGRMQRCSILVPRFPVHERVQRCSVLVQSLFFYPWKNTELFSFGT